MSDWIEYDGTNPPENRDEVRVRFRNGTESKDFEEARFWAWHSKEPDECEDTGFLISHFMLKEEK